MDVELFNFTLPQKNIALRPVTPRDSAKMLQVKDGEFSHHSVHDLPDLLRAGDVLVLNETKVIKAKINGLRPAREHGGGGDVKIGLNLHKQLSNTEWRAFARPAKRLKINDIIIFSEQLSARIDDIQSGGDIGLEFILEEAAPEQIETKIMAEIERLGHIPLPPYIAKHRVPDAQDELDYQTVFAKEKGSVAAPTAGLHMTPELLDELAQKGVQIERLILHVGAGTFLPMSSDDTDDHKMHSEWYHIDDQTADRLNTAKREGRRIITVGTTSLRALESSVDAGGMVQSGAKDTEIFITPGYDWKIVDGMMTNFHLPRSTLFMLVCALAGRQTMQQAYAAAIENQYRFYSYGDSSLLWRQNLDQ